MAINYVGFMAETTVPANPKTFNYQATAPAGSLIVMGLSARRSSGVPGIVSITDEVGNTFDWVAHAASVVLAGVAWCRTPVEVNASHTITVDWNASLTAMWVSVHAFESAGDIETDTNAGSANDTTPQATLTVAGSDWLTFANFYFPNGPAIVTPVNSSVSRDTWNNGEVFSRNGTTGSTHTIGGTIAGPEVHYFAAVSFPFLSAGLGNERGQPTLIGV